MSHVADAATLTINPGGNGGIYHVGDLITITVIGDSQGLTDMSIFGRLDFSNPAVAAPNIDPATPVQHALGASWNLGVTSCDASSCRMLNQVSLTPTTAPSQIISTVSFVATTVGTTTVSWGTSPASEKLDFFGLASAPVTSISVVGWPTLTLDRGGVGGVYHVGDTITITVNGNPNFGLASYIMGRLTFSNASIGNIASATPHQNFLTDGAFPWMEDVPLECSATGCTMFDQIDGYGTAVTNQLVSTVSFVATSPGTTALMWDADANYLFEFFGFLPPPPAIITVLPAAPPVPISRGAGYATAALLLLAQLAVLRRRSRSHS